MAQHDEQARGDDIEQVGENNEVQEHGDLKEYKTKEKFSKNSTNGSLSNITVASLHGIRQQLGDTIL